MNLDAFADRIRALAGEAQPALVALNGHSSSGKTTLAGLLVARLPRAAVLHTDDLAWNQGVFTWDRLLLSDVLPVVRAGRPLNYRPPAWQERQRPGSIQLPGDLDYLVVEGVGASQASVASALHVVVWVETDEPTRLARDLVRVSAGEMSSGGYTDWMAEENAYTTAQRPWERADLVVHGGHLVHHDPASQAVTLASGFPR